MVTRTTRLNPVLCENGSGNKAFVGNANDNDKPVVTIEFHDDLAKLSDEEKYELCRMVEDFLLDSEEACALIG